MENWKEEKVNAPKNACGSALLRWPLAAALVLSLAGCRQAAVRPGRKRRCSAEPVRFAAAAADTVDAPLRCISSTWVRR
ncbi:MAG: hypothetical protein ACLVJH_03710 [Faecalibacterium prausnitzii]